MNDLIQYKKQRKGDSDILLIAKDEKYASYDLSNSYFQSITDSLHLFEWPLWSADQICDGVDRVINSFSFHIGFKNIKHNYNITRKFSFTPVSEEFVKDTSKVH